LSDFYSQLQLTMEKLENEESESPLLKKEKSEEVKKAT
jgi:hypothetical protein